MLLRFIISMWLLLGLAVQIPAMAQQHFQIELVDEQTGRGVPLVELETVNGLRYVTDSNGLIAFHEPGLMETDVYFHIRSHGYEYPKDGFGFRGKVLRPKAGGAMRISIKRMNIAERMYRMTGEGIYSDTILLGKRAPTSRPVLNGQVMGQDSVQVLSYRGKLRWFWGDTGRASYPLGNFAMSGATSLLPGQGGLDPSVGVDLQYFVDEKGFSRKMAPTKEHGLMWLDGYVTLPDENGQERMYAHHARMKGLEAMLEHGLMVYNDQTDTFEKIVEFDLKDQFRCPRGHPLRLRENGPEYFYFPTPFPNVRVKADIKSLRDPGAYESFTCLVAGSRYEKGKSEVQRQADGKVVYGWKLNTSPTGQKEESELIAAGKLKAEEARFQVRDVDGGKPVRMHGGSVYWNEFRKKWIMIAVEIGGTSMLGEVWFTESDSPTGPWTLARKVVTHEKYSFYNPKHHPFFDQQGGRMIYFEGTYTESFSGNPIRTPRYDYNQVMYRLDLSDPRLNLKPR